MEIGTTGKLAFEYLGNSSLFRESQLWQEINPLTYSALFPGKIPEDLEAITEKKLAKTAEGTTLESGVNAEVKAILQGSDKAKEALASDPISQSVAEDNTSIIFDDTKIDYEIFFLE